MEHPINDSDVKRVLGEDAYDVILNNVRWGIINGQKMTDIAAELDPTVCGNTLRRVPGYCADNILLEKRLSAAFL